MIFLHHYQREDNIKTFSRKKLLENLAYYLHKDQNDITLNFNENGKPMADGVYFSISHCGKNAVQVFCKNTEVGIDIEYRNHKRPFLKLAQRYYHKVEYNQLAQLPSEDAINLFYNLWTAKEAVCKAQGGRLWYYLADNYLTKNLNLSPVIKGLNLHFLNTLPNFSLCIATTDTFDNINYV